jgi:AbrB family looped-hinge helix DNA binding protein
MTAKNQITLPKKITDILGLEKGTMFKIEVSKNHIELIPLETKEKAFTEEEYKKPEALAAAEEGREKRVAKRFIDDPKKGKA